MKHVYTFTIVALAFVASAFLPQQMSAQCLCSGGLPSNQQTFVYTLLPTTAAVTTVPFQQFNPSVGTLVCASLTDSISGISTTGVRNLDPIQKTQYKFLLSVNNDIEGPAGSLSVTEDFTRTYGPDSLDKFGTPGDTITYGPDTIFHNTPDLTFASNVAPYIGLGNVNFTYTINGGLVSLKGGLNYHDQIITNYWGYFMITYYWCPSVTLATTITNFMATDKGKFVQLQWEAANDQNNIVYEIQYSTNGSQYTPIGHKQAGASSAGTVSAYQYQYNLASTDVGQIYFRIKRTDPDGHVSYSIIKSVNLEGGATVGIQTFPNPVVNNVTLSFDEIQTGNFRLELINTTGQLVQQREVTLNATTLVNMNLNITPAKGMYFLRAKDLTHSKQYITKIMIE